MTTIMTPCTHSETVPVNLEATDEVVAYLCTNCLIKMPEDVPVEPAPEPRWSLSRYPHVVYRIDVWEGEYGDKTEVRVPVGDTRDIDNEANLVGSRIASSSDHTIMLDLDVEAHLVPSSTAGHNHLYIDVVMPWRKYRRLLRALWRAGVIEEGYYKSSVRRRHSDLRLPGVHKGESG